MSVIGWGKSIGMVAGYCAGAATLATFVHPSQSVTATFGMICIVQPLFVAAGYLYPVTLPVIGAGAVMVYISGDYDNCFILKTKKRD